MQVRTSHGDFLRFGANLPSKLPDLQMPGGQLFYAQHSTGEYFYQSIETDNYKVFKSLYRTNQPVTLQVNADRPWLGFRLVLKNHIRHFMGGAREVFLKQGQFNFAYQPRINDLLLLDKGAEYLAFDMEVSESFLKSLSVSAPRLDKLLNHLKGGQPYLLLPRFGWGNAAVLNALEDFERCPLVDPAAGKLLRCVIRAALDGEPALDLPTDKVEGLFRARNMILNNLHRHLTVQQLAQAAAMNEFSFKQTFRSVFRISPYQYLKSQRLRIAKRLLLTTRRTLQNIADEAGYQYASNLIVAFRKAYHVSPTQWRNQHIGCIMQ